MIYRLMKFVLIGLFAMYSAGVSASDDSSDDGIVHLTDANFEKEIKKGIVLVDFWATWCYPCKIQGRIIENMMPKVPEGVKIAKVDTDKNKNVSMIYSIRSIPTMIIFKDGKIAKRYVGVKQEAELLQIFNELLENE